MKLYSVFVTRFFLRPLSDISIICLLKIGLLILVAHEASAAYAQVLESSSPIPELAHSNWDSYGEDFLQGNPLILKASRQKSTVPASEPVVKLPNTALPKVKPNTPNKEDVVSVKWLRKNYLLLEERAIDNPSTQNVEAYLYTKRIILDKAQNFSTKVEEITKSDPFLNENNRIPYASGGATTIRNANLLAQQDALRQMAMVGGIYVFIDGHCIFCAQQLPVLAALRETYGLESWVISVDGTAPSGYKGQMARDNGLYKKLGLKLTPSIVYVDHPKAYAGGVDLNNYLIISQGYYAADELTKVMAYAAYKKDLVALATKRSLNIWDRGLASAQDLSTLSLDVNRPESFRGKLQPLLEKNY